MVNVVKNLYQTPDLPGDGLVQPLKNFHNSSLNRIAKIFAGVILYPPLALLAGIGMAIKLTGICALKRANEGAKTNVNTCETGVKNTKLFFHEHDDLVSGNGIKYKVVGQFSISKKNVADASAKIRTQIDNCTKRFQRAYSQAEGTIKNGRGSISYQLLVRSS